MSVRSSLLALLAEAPTHGYGLKSSFEENTGGAWPLNIGQVYTTLARLERDGLAEPCGEAVDGRQSWRITPAGKAELEAWYAQAVEADPPPRDELAIKVLLAVAADDVDVGGILQAQRVVTMERLQRYTRMLARADPTEELPWVLLLDALILKAEAEVAWLDKCEQRIGKRT